MRARNIKPGFWENEFLGQCSRDARLLFMGLWSLADREGRLIWRPGRIRGKILPYDSDLTGEDIARFVVELEAHKERNGEPMFLELYEVDGVEYLEIKNFKKHQRPHKQERPSTLPDKFGTYSEPVRNQFGTSSEQIPNLHALESQNPRIPESLNPGKDPDKDPKKDPFVGGERPPSGADAIVMTFPVQKGRSWNLSQTMFDRYVKEFGSSLRSERQAPEAAIRCAMDKARLWCEDLPRRRKTPGGMQRFLTRWLERTAKDADEKVKPPAERPLQYDPISGRAIKPIELEVYLLPINITDDTRAEITRQSIEWEKAHWPEEWWDEAKKEKDELEWQSQKLGRGPTDVPVQQQTDHVPKPFTDFDKACKGLLK